MKTFKNGQRINSLKIAGNTAKSLFKGGVKIYQEPEKVFQFNGSSSWAFLIDNTKWGLNIGDEFYIEFCPEQAKNYDLFGKARIGSQANRWMVNDVGSSKGVFLVNNTSLLTDLRETGNFALEWQFYSIKVENIDSTTCKLVRNFNGTVVETIVNKTQLPTVANNTNRFTIGRAESGGTLRYFRGKIRMIRRNNDILIAQNSPTGTITTLNSSAGNTFTFNNITIVNSN